MKTENIYVCVCDTHTRRYKHRFTHQDTQVDTQVLSFYEAKVVDQAPVHQQIRQIVTTFIMS